MTSKERSNPHEPRGRGRPNMYKRYLQDPAIPVPRSTLHSRKKKHLNVSNEHEEVLDTSNYNDIANFLNVGIDITENGELYDWQDASDGTQYEGNEDSDEYTAYALEEENKDSDEFIIYALEEENENLHNENEVRNTLYPGCTITKEESQLLLISYILRHGATDLALEDLIDLVDCHLPYPVHHSKFLFLKYFPTLVTPEKLYYCPRCQNILSLNNLDKLSCETCSLQYDKQFLTTSNNYFIKIPLEPQLQHILTSDTYFKLRRTSDTDSDITSGTAYTKLLERGMIDRYDLTLQLNTDGVRPWKSSKMCLWPVYFAVNELPYKERSENILLAGIWYGPSKPDMNIYLKPFVEELNHLHLDGFDCITAEGEELLVKVHTIASPVDSPARMMLQNIMQFNGQYGCSFCLHPGEEIAVGGGHARIYRGDCGPPRTSRQHSDDAKEATTSGRAVNGVKGPSVLQLLLSFNIISSFVPDYMHAILLGVVKTLLQAFFDQKYKEKPWYIGNHFIAINERLKQMKPCIEISRTPRSLSERSNWKASECKNFLLYYSLYCFHGYLPLAYYRHWFLLVRASHILMRQKVIPNVVKIAQECLKDFVAGTERLYDDHFCRFNTHLLLHVVSSVKRFGALWACSTFMFEIYNSVLVNLIKSSSRAIPEQISKLYLRSRVAEKRAAFVFGVDNCSHRAKKLYLKLTKSIRIKRCSDFGPHLRLFGTPIAISLDVRTKLAIEQCLQTPVNECAEKYQRFLYKKMILHAKDYMRMEKRNNSLIQIISKDFVEITGLYKVTGVANNELHVVIIAEKCEPVPRQNCPIRNALSGDTNDVTTTVRITNNITAFFPSAIFRKCVKVEFENDQAYVIPLVNPYERD